MVIQLFPIASVCELRLVRKQQKPVHAVEFAPFAAFVRELRPLFKQLFQVLAAQLIRNRYTILDLLDELGLLREAADAVTRRMTAGA